MILRTGFGLPADARNQFPGHNISSRSAFADTLDKRLFEYAKNTPPDISQDIDKLVEYLKLPATSKRDIAKTFSYWIMQNIAYDIYGFLNESYNQQGIIGTLKEKKGICQDYAELFKAMCDRADIKCYVITGYAKAFGYKPGNKFTKANHAWNVIWLDDAYYLMDLTWSSGYIGYVDDSWHYFLKPDISQFFADPDIFVEKHLPANPIWQLQNHPVSMESFLRFADHSEMLNDSSKYFSFKDSISMYEKLDKDEREIKSANDAYSFYPVLKDFAYHYYNQAVVYSNTATDYYNAAVNSYNGEVSNKTLPVPTGGYNKDGILNAINYFGKASKLLAKISNYSDDVINAAQLLEKCNKGIEISKDLLNTLK
ncbi:MAG: transglutaminase domain-containing protein [Mucilaginibacter sp.]